jgi:hypothetical protein
MFALLSLAALAQDAPLVAPATGEVAALAPAEPASTTVKLDWELPVGQVTRVVQQTAIRMDTPNGSQQSTVSATAERAVQTGGQLGRDTVAWTEKLLASAVEIDMAGQKVAWALGDKADPPAGFEAMPLLAGASFAVSVGPDLAVAVKVSEPGAVVEKAKGAGVGAKFAEMAIEEGRLAADLRRQIAWVAMGDWTIGQSRQESVSLPLAGLGEVAVQRTLTLDRIDASRAIVKETWTLGQGAVDGLSVTALTGVGELIVDVAAHHPLQRTLDLELTVQVDGEKPVELKSSLHQDTRFEAR